MSVRLDCRRLLIDGLFGTAAGIHAAGGQHDVPVGLLAKDPGGDLQVRLVVCAGVDHDVPIMIERPMGGVTYFSPVADDVLDFAAVCGG